MQGNSKTTKELEIARLNQAIGAKVRQRRIELGIPRTELARRVGVSQQQFEKYEKGSNRISVGMLVLIAEYLETSLEYFYKNLINTPDFTSSIKQRMCLELARNFQSITNPKHRKLVLMATKLLTDE